MGFDSEPSTGAPTDAQYVTLATDADLSAERTLNAGTLLSLTDNGAGGNATLDSNAAAANVPDWSEDGNSPFTASGAGTLSGSLSGTYDFVMLLVHDIHGDSSNSEQLELTFNNDTTSNYFYTDTSGTRTSSASHWDMDGGVTPSNSAGTTGKLILSGRWTKRFYGGFTGGAIDNASLVRGLHTALTSPLDSFTLQWSSGNITGRVEAYGKDI